ncbi:hypothetical protein ZHAS_00021972 [Anopheles sinensis]|uniref:Uncharacterized protein n=1 Tax=Anopheles sinensis TaxID=74873 RepID=A0A084WTC1_ANOSI|nr:hypothetical protein ZHAS_00021972 [Anopheles sinensis]
MDVIGANHLVNAGMLGMPATLLPVRTLIMLGCHTVPPAPGATPIPTVICAGTIIGAVSGWEALGVRLDLHDPERADGGSI